MPRFKFQRPWFTPGGHLLDRGIHPVSQALIDEYAAEGAQLLPSDAVEVDEHGDDVPSFAVGEDGVTTVAEASARGKKPPIGDAYKAVAQRKAAEFSEKLSARDEPKPVRRRSAKAD